MANNKYYWIKLKTDFFSQDTIDFLLSKKNGCQYVVLYQMLCLASANNDGFLATKFDDVMIPYDVNKIVRDTKYFDYDTVTVALELYKKLGLIYQEENNILRLSNMGSMIGSESASREAVKKRAYREKLKEQKGTLIGTSEGTKKGTNCPTDIDIEKEIDIEIDIDNKYSNNSLYTTTTKIEKNIGRTLNSIEVEKIQEWLLSFTEEIILYAFSIAILNNKVTFSYVNGILNNWKSCNYTTIEEIKKNEIKREEKETKKVEDIFYYDWLNDDENN